jgi:hypothetical protein
VNHTQIKTLSAPRATFESASKETALRDTPHFRYITATELHHGNTMSTQRLNYTKNLIYDYVFSRSSNDHPSHGASDKHGASLKIDPPFTDKSYEVAP